jgi:hypothetical protein
MLNSSSTRASMHVEIAPVSTDRSRIGANMSAEDFVRTGSKVGAHHGSEYASGPSFTLPDHRYWEEL